MVVVGHPVLEASEGIAAGGDPRGGLEGRVEAGVGIDLHLVSYLPDATGVGGSGPANGVRCARGPGGLGRHGGHRGWGVVLPGEDVGRPGALLSQCVPGAHVVVVPAVLLETSEVVLHGGGPPRVAVGGCEVRKVVVLAVVLNASHPGVGDGGPLGHEVEARIVPVGLLHRGRRGRAGVLGGAGGSRPVRYLDEGVPGVDPVVVLGPVGEAGEGVTGLGRPSRVGQGRGEGGRIVDLHLVALAPDARIRHLGPLDGIGRPGGVHWLSGNARNWRRRAILLRGLDGGPGPFLAQGVARFYPVVVGGPVHQGGEGVAAGGLPAGGEVRAGEGGRGVGLDPVLDTAGTHAV